MVYGSLTILEVKAFKGVLKLCDLLQIDGYQRMFYRLDPRLYVGPDWDLYLLTALAMILALVVLWRRQR